MTVTIAGRPTYRLAGKHSRLVLGLIQGGRQWLDWAVYDPFARYHFEDESALVVGVQAGLHASPLLLLPTIGLMVGPLKLMTIDLEDLRILVDAEGGDERDWVAKRVKDIRAAHHLVTQAELADDAVRLDKLGLDGPVLQGMALNDRLAIHNLLWRDGVEIDPDPDAAAFAIDRARTPLEFIDHYLAYLAYVARRRWSPEEERAGRVEGAIDTLTPLLFQALDSPRIDGGLIAPGEVSAAIEEWQMMGRRVGFSRLSQGVQQVIAHTDFPYREEDAPGIVARYLAEAQALIGSAELHRGHIGQDGASCTFHIRSEAGEAAIALSADGIVTLSRCIPRLDQRTTRSTTKRRK